VAWGWNAYGQCNVPATPIGITYVEAAAGDYHTVARRSDGVVVAFGRNDYGQCNVPTLPVGLSYVDIACGGYHTVARRSNGTMSAWGYNGNGQCTIPTIPVGVSVSEIAAGLGHTVARSQRQHADRVRRQQLRAVQHPASRLRPLVVGNRGRLLPRLGAP
jgi:hypothetical protein